MYESEIMEQKWKVKSPVVVSKLFMGAIPVVEQGLYISETIHGIFVDCSRQEGITRLAKSALFTLHQITVSSVREGFILSVRGKMADKGFTIKKAKRTMTPESREKMSKLAKARFGKGND